MGRRGDLALLISFILLFTPIAYAWDSEASSNINTIYETNTADFIINLANPQTNEKSINTVDVETSGFTINSAEDSSGWRNLVQGTVLSWDIFIPFGDLFDWVQNLPFINLGISSDASQNFRFNAYAHKVTEDTTYEWPVTSTFHDDTDDVQTLTIIVLNDYTGPVLSDWTPQDGDYVKEGTDDLLSSINATDPETGVLQVFFNYIDCAKVSNQSAKVSMNLTRDADIFSDLADVSQYPDSTEVCFSFIAENNGGTFSNVSGIFIIDGIAPVVTLIAPDDGAIMNALSMFEFLAQDNLAPTMDCSLYSDGEVYDTITVDNNINAQISAVDMPEGKHNWSVSCTDLAGWTGYSDERTYILDKTPPEITLNNPDDGAIVKAGTIINITVTDNVQLGDVSYQIDMDPVVDSNDTIIIDTSAWLDGVYVITVNATDAAGNIATENFVIIIDRLAPVVNLMVPADGDTVDYHVLFTFNVSDNHDTMIDCDVIVDGTVLVQTVVNTTQSEVAVVPAIVDLGDHEWHVICIDDADNVGTSSQSWNFTAVDITGPDITVNDIGTIVRGSIATLNITLWDISGIDDSSIVVEVTDPNGLVVPVIVTEQAGYYTGDFITTVASEIGTYDVSVYAEDEASPANSNTGTGAFDVTYAYHVNINANPNPQQEGQEVIMTGSVRFDNGSLVPEEFVTLVLPDTTIAVALDSVTGAFTHTGVFAAGNHDITATITPENGFTFDDTVTLVINANAAPPGDNGDGDGDDDDPDGGGNFACPVDECYENNECVPCTETNNNNQNNNGNNNNLDNTFLGDGDSGLVYYCGDGDCDYTENCNKCAEDCGECKECDKDSECGKGKKCNNGKCIGQQGWAGKATGFLNFSRINTSLFWWAVLILLSIMFVLAYLRKRGTPGFSKEDTMGLDDYIDNINRKQ